MSEGDAQHTTRCHRQRSEAQWPFRSCAAAPSGACPAARCVCVCQHACALDGRLQRPTSRPPATRQPPRRRWRVSARRTVVRGLLQQRTPAPAQPAGAATSCAPALHPVALPSGSCGWGLRRRLRGPRRPTRSSSTSKAAHNGAWIGGGRSGRLQRVCSPQAVPAHTVVVVAHLLLRRRGHGGCRAGSGGVGDSDGGGEQ